VYDPGWIELEISESSALSPLLESLLEFELELDPDSSNGFSVILSLSNLTFLDNPLSLFDELGLSVVCLQIQ
jgi:hypothetical protein